MKQLYVGTIKCISAALSLCFLAACSGCDFPFIYTASALVEPPETLSVCSWNMQTFFDAQEAGTEYWDFSVSSGWSEQKYTRRLQKLSDISSVFPAGGPDILALIEIENESVLRTLASGPFKRFSFTDSVCAAAPGAALSVGLLSRYPIIESRTHSLRYASVQIPRPVLEVRIDIGGRDVLIFVCHFKSKLGNAEEGRLLRRAASSAIATRMRVLQEAEPSLDILVLGDLNENEDEFTRNGGQYIHALMPDTEAAAALVAYEAEENPSITALEFFVLSQEQPPCSKQFPNSCVLYSPWYASTYAGSYVYKDQWERIDHLLLSPALFDASGWEFLHFSVIDDARLLNSNGYPASYNPRTEYGVSDHLPLWIDLAYGDS